MIPAVIIEGLRLVSCNPNANSAREFIECSKKDLEAIEILIDRGLYSQSVYHLQQAVEKVAKGLWILDLVPLRYSELRDKILRTHEFMRLISSSVRLNEVGCRRKMTENPSFILNAHPISPAVNASLAFGEYGLYREVLTASFVPLYNWLATIGVQDFSSMSYKDAIDEELRKFEHINQQRSENVDEILCQIANSDLFISAFKKLSVRKRVLLASDTQILDFVKDSLDRIGELISIAQSEEERTRLNIWSKTYFSSMVVAIVTQFHETTSRYPASGYGILPSHYDNGKVGITNALPELISLTKQIVGGADTLLNPQ